MVGSLLALSFLICKLKFNLQPKPGSPGNPSWSSLLMPASLMGIAIAGLLVVRYWIGNDTVSFRNFETTTVPRMISVFALMAVLLVGVMWSIKSLGRFENLWVRVCTMSIGFFAALFLLGQTSISETNVQTPFFVMVLVALVAAIILNKTVAGRYLKALGNNEEATRYSGIDTDLMKILAYVLCSVCAGIGAILFTLDSNNVEPSGHGSFYELYAIAAAVLGGCSLRGGEGSILGVLIGASILQMLYNAPDMIGIPSQLELFTIGMVIAVGVSADEIVKRITASKDLRQQRKNLESAE